MYQEFARERLAFLGPIIRLTKRAWARRKVPSGSLPLVLVITVGAVPGCAFRYYDPESGTEHIWGLGRVVMRAAATNSGRRALVTEVSTMGVSVGTIEREHYVTLGWDQRSRIEMLEDDVLCLQRSKVSLLDVRIGSAWPHPTTSDDPKGVSECRPD